MTPSAENTIKYIMYPKPVLGIGFYISFVDGPTSIVMSPQQDSYTVGTIVNMSANSNPPIQNYKWVDVKTNTTLGMTNILRITERMLGERVIRMEVCNNIPERNPSKRCRETELNITVVTSTRFQ